VRTDEPSVTAMRVAARRLSIPRLATGYGRPDEEERLARDLSASLSAGTAGPLPADASLPLDRHLEGRTRFFDRVVVGALESGISQVAILAAGYDGRALRYAKPGVRWFEIDHPATQADKQGRLARLAVATPQVAFAAADFTEDDVAAALAGAAHDPTLPTLFLCEGIAVYLEPAVLGRLLRSIRSRAAAGSRLAISLSAEPGSAEAEERRQRFEAAVGAAGEPARNRVTAITAAALFAETGWRELLPEAHPEERAAGGPPAPGGADRGRARRAGFVLAAPS